MDGDGQVDDVFATGRLWKSSSLFEDPATYESSLFAPIQLDGDFLSRRALSLVDRV